MRFVSPRRAQHLWAVKLAGAERAAALTETKEEAVKIARQLAKKNHEELVIQGRDGRIQEKDSHGNDPPSIPG